MICEVNAILFGCLIRFLYSEFRRQLLFSSVQAPLRYQVVFGRKNGFYLFLSLVLRNVLTFNVFIKQNLNVVAFHHVDRCFAILVLKLIKSMKNEFRLSKNIYSEFTTNVEA